MRRASSRWSATTSDETAACPACGLELPLYARFCARCGTPQPARAKAVPAPPAGYLPPTRAPALAPLWVIVLFWVGAASSLALAAVYASIAASPRLPDLQADPSQVRTSAILIAVWAAALFGAQIVAAYGLTRRRPWALVPATLACVGWALTCIGLPVAVFVLAGLWRSPRPR
jgi:hypothetical protein